MNKLFKRLFLICTLLLPVAVLAADSNGTSISSALNFRPPASDRSVIFLSNIFGVVDGILAGTGSQIIGTMFGVFNAAVLSLGGIILVYTLLVSTMNTAQEGEFLGRQWSSVWIPLRSVFGIGLLLPKASGYCMMQIFVMWVVVQGVGAADKVWGTALDYLGRGGVIIQPNMDPQQSARSANNTIFQTAAGMLSSQVCMLGIEHQINVMRKNAEAGANNLCRERGPSSPNGNPELCNKAVPNFINTVNISGSNAGSSGSHTISLPNFPASEYPLYSVLNGVCGQLKWKDVDVSALKDDSTEDSGGFQLNQQQLDLTQQSRSLALQQMWDNLSSIAQTIVDNNQKLSSSDTTCESLNANAFCKKNPNMLPFGSPMTANMKHCSRNADDGPTACTNWATGDGATALFTGTELQMAVTSYNAIMVPALNLMSQEASSAKKLDKSDFGQQRQFITQAKSQGWIMAGAYFFKLAILNNSSQGSPTDSASKAGLELTLVKDTITSKLKGNVFANINIDPVTQLLNNDPPAPGGSKQSKIVPDITKLLQGGGSVIYDDADATTVYGYIVNSVFMRLPGQNFVDAPEFVMEFNFDPSMEDKKLPKSSFHGGFLNIPGAVTSFLYNYLLRYVINLFISIATPLLSQLFYAVVAPPLMLMSTVFATAVQHIQNPTVNPIMALAAMGGSFINGTVDFFVNLVAIYVPASAIPYLGPAFSNMLLLLLPLIMPWIMVMLTVGATCAYYIPFVPFLLFTFGSIAWLVGVIEAMVAAPIVALGVTHPEGHQAFGKGDQAIMLLLNVFLRPSMMIFGYIFGIMMTYVGVWILNSGFSMVISDIQGLNIDDSTKDSKGDIYRGAGAAVAAATGNIAAAGAAVAGSLSGTNKIYTQWTGTFFYFFSILIYSSAYMTIAQKSFQLIFMLPDRILRWLSGGVQESLGGEIAKSMSDEVQQAAKQGAEATAKGVSGAATAGMKMAGIDLKESEVSSSDEGEGPDESGAEGSDTSTSSDGGTAAG